MSATPPERIAALLRRQQTTTARLRAGLPALLDELEALEEPALQPSEEPTPDAAPGDEPPPSPEP